MVWSTTGSTREKTDQERYLEMELEQYREAEDRRLEEARERRAREADRRRVEAEQAIRTADDWPDALRKQAILLETEACLSEDPAYFTDGAAACRRALELWKEDEERAGRIRELEAQIAEVRDEIRDVVALSLEEEMATDGARSIVDALREGGDPSEFLNW